MLQSPVSINIRVKSIYMVINSQMTIGPIAHLSPFVLSTQEYVIIPSHNKVVDGDIGYVRTYVHLLSSY